MAGRKFKINDRVRVTRGPLYFHRGIVLDYELTPRSYKVEIPMIGVRWFRVNELEPAELARQRIQ